MKCTIGTTIKIGNNLFVITKIGKAQYTASKLNRDGSVITGQDERIVIQTDKVVGAGNDWHWVYAQNLDRTPAEFYAHIDKLATAKHTEAEEQERAWQEKIAHWLQDIIGGKRW